ncbi:hypothetical protein [Sphingomonas sp.]
MSGALRIAAFTIGLAITAPLHPQSVPAPTSQPSGPAGTSSARSLPQPAKPGEKQGFIRRQVGRDVNPDQPDPETSPLPEPPKVGEREGFIRRQVGRDVNPDQVRPTSLVPPAGRVGTTTQPVNAQQTKPPQR